MAATFAIKALVWTTKHLMGEVGTPVHGVVHSSAFVFSRIRFVFSALSWKLNAAVYNSEIQHGVLTLSSGADFF